MLLALDVGNTNITIGVFKRKEIIEVFRITTKLPRTSDEFGILISSLLKEKGLDDNTIIFFFSDHGGCVPRGKG